MEQDVMIIEAPVRNEYITSITDNSFDLPALSKKLKLENAWADGELNTTILLESPHKKIMLTALHKETEIKSFQSDASITFQVIEGKMKFQTRKETVNMVKGQTFTLCVNTNYRLTAKEDSVFLLTIINTLIHPKVN